MAFDVVLLALEDCVALSVYGPADLFHAANVIAQHDGQGKDVFRVRILSPDGNSVRSSGGHMVAVEGKLEDAAGADVIIVSGIGLGSEEEIVNRIVELDGVAKHLRNCAGKETVLAACCTGTMLLAQTELLDERPATTTWWMEAYYRSLFPKVRLQTDEILVDDGTIITSAAGASSLDLALHLISRFAGPKLSRLCARYMVVDDSRHLQRPYAIPWHLKTRDALIEKADGWIRKNAAGSCRVEDLASFAGVSTRTLLRRFQAHVGVTPQAYIQNVRMELAKTKLEETSVSIAELGLEFDFSDENAFRRAFVQSTGMTPTQYRKHFRR